MYSVPARKAQCRFYLLTTACRYSDDVTYMYNIKLAPEDVCTCLCVSVEVFFHALNS